MKSRFTILLFVFGILVVSCAKQIEEPSTDNRLALTTFQSDFAISDSLQTTTRATETKFQNGDEIGLFIHTSAIVAGDNIHSSNVRYLTVDAGRNWQAGSKYGGSIKVGGSYYATGYYPYNVGILDPLLISHSVKVDQSMIAGDKSNNLEMSDFMVTAPGTVTVRGENESVVALIFKHVMTKLAISVGIPNSIEGVPVTSLKSIRIKGLNKDCEINLATSGVKVKSATVADITPRLASGTGLPGETSVWEAIVVPQTVAGGSPMVEFVCGMDNGGEDSLLYTVPAGDELVLKSGSRVAMMLGISSNPAFLTPVDFSNGDGRVDVQMQIKVKNGFSWSVVSSAGWLSLSDKLLADGGVYGSKVTGVSNGGVQTIYIKVLSNSGALALPREGVLTLTDSNGGSIMYRVFQNYTLFGPSFSAWSITAGGGQSRAIEGFTTNQTWSFNMEGDAIGLKIAKSADGAPELLPYEGAGPLAANALFVQAPGANNGSLARTGKVVVEAKGSNPRQFAEFVVTQAAPALALSTTAQSVRASATSATFNVISTSNQMGVKYTASAGAGASGVAPDTEQTVGVTTNYSGTVTVTFPANSDKTVKKTIVATVKYGAGTLTHTITQASAEPETVIVGGIKWTSTNLTGDYGTNTGHSVEGSPEGYGAFFKWGCSFVYQRESTTGDGGGWGSAITGGAATSPSSSSTGQLGYDYVGLSGGTNPGDPCQKIGTQYRTPTRAQWQALVAAGKSAWTTYNGVYGYFFGAKAGSCNNTTIQDGCIFLPASGFRQYLDGAQYSQGISGNYWSSSVYNSDQGWDCYFDSGGANPNYTGYRGGGFSVRCVDATPVTVEIAGTKWLTSNLLGNQGTNTNHQVSNVPNDYGMFFKWGTSFVYQRASSSSDGGGWSNVATVGAATSPSSSSTGGTGYDYVGLSGGTNPGDPCVKLNSGSLKYRTPTRAQWQALAAIGSKLGAYNNISGRFFGSNAASCTNTSIASGCIFLPASGCRDWNGGVQNYQGISGWYRSSSVSSSDNGYDCNFNGSGVNPDGANSRGHGFSVRCVQE